MRVRSAVLAACLLGAVTLSAPTPAHAAAANDGTYFNTAPTRLADTRSGLGLPQGTLKAGTTTRLQVLGQAGVPAVGVSSVVVNVTVAKATAAGWLTAYASGTPTPATSTINYPAGWTGAATTTVAVGSDGGIEFTVGAGETDLVVDVVGYYASADNDGAQGAFYNPTATQRVLDTRRSSAIAPGGSVTVQIDFGSTPGQIPQALLVNLTALGSAGNGWLTAWSGAGTPPSTSSVNVAAGEISPNQVVVPVRNVGGTVYAFTVSNTSRVAVQALADWSGTYMTDSVGFGYVHVAVPPTRILDSRDGTGTARGKFTAKQTRNIVVPSSLLSSDGLTVAVEGTLTGTGASGTTWLTQWPSNADELGDATPPNASNLNLTTGLTRANAVTSLLGSLPMNTVHLFNAAGSTHVVEDITGRFDLGGATPAAAAARAAATRAHLATARVSVR